jgi:hypothetical protein
MKSASCVFAAALSFAVLLGGCGKQDAPVATEAEQALPKEEQMPTPATPPGATTAAAPAPDEGKSNSDFEAWFKKYGLDLNDPGMLDGDADGDGATNRDEFLADSDPKDPNVRPGIHKTIRLKEYTEVRLPFVVRAVAGETATVEFNADGTGTQEKVKKGDTIKGTKLKVDRVDSRTDTDKHGVKVDLSQLVLTDTDTNERVVALKDLPTRTSASFATLVSADGKETLKVREGETFTWPSEPGVAYKVIDLRMDQVVLKDETNGKTTTVPRL